MSLSSLTEESYADAEAGGGRRKKQKESSRSVSIAVNEKKGDRRNRSTTIQAGLSGAHPAHLQAGSTHTKPTHPTITNATLSLTLTPPRYYLYPKLPKYSTDETTPPITLLSATMPPLSAFILPLLLLLAPSAAHNITRILAKHPEFSNFNHYLTLTHLAGEINRRQTITVLALDNAAMSDLLAKQLSIYTLKNVLSLHVLVDYFGAKKLHQITDGTALTSTMFQATGSAPGSSGYINITDLKGGKVAFGAQDNGGELNSLYVKSVEELPYNISVLQISRALTSTEAEAPTPGPSQLNLTSILAQGCKTFSDLLKASGAEATFQDNIDGGLTVFCPTDAVINSFMPKYKNLTAAQKLSLLLYHGVPVYLSRQMLKSNNGIINTLATDGAKKFDFTVQNDGEDVTLKTKIVTVKVTGTLKDEDPLVVYKVDKMLQPRELFKVPEDVEAPAPAPASPKTAAKGKKKKGKVADAPADADAPSDSDAADQTAEEKNGVEGLSGVRLIVLALSMWVGALVM